MSAAASKVCPWDVDSALKPKRLLLLAQARGETRDAGARGGRIASAGDTNWGIGCKAHERFVHAVDEARRSTRASWLRVHRDGLSFMSFIEGVAVRAYHGDGGPPDARHVYAAQAGGRDATAVDPRQLALAVRRAARGGGAGAKWAWLMAVETDDEGRAVRVVFFQANAAGATRNAWVAPVDIDGIAAAQRPGEERHAARATRTSAARAGARRRPVQVALV